MFVLCDTRKLFDTISSGRHMLSINLGTKIEQSAKEALDTMNQ